MTTLDSSDFIEITLKHLVRDKNTFLKAKDLKVTADDFGDQATGIQAYREVVSIVMEVNDSPISYDVFLNAIGTRVEQNKFAGSDLGLLAQFIEQIYSGDLSSEYIVSNLPEFIKRKRGLKLQITHKDDLDSLAKEYAKLVDDITISDANEHVEVINPFESIHRRSNVAVIPTGLPRIDAVIQGLGIQEMALIMAASGGGKTAMATVLGKNAAAGGKKVLYCSLEEPAINITQRYYANVMKMSYTNLYRGSVEQEFLDRKLNEIDPDLRQALVNNLRIVDLRDLTPLSPSVLNEWLVKYCTDNDFWPDLIIIDQLEFMKANEDTKSQWEMYEAILLSLFKMSAGLLGGHKVFSFYILHQLTDMRLNYTSREIAGFKGAMRKCSLVIVLGRKDNMSPILNIHSLKARHSPNFKLNHMAAFERMDIEDGAPTENPNQRTLSLSDNSDLPVISAANSLVRTPVEQILPPLPANPIT